MAYLAPLPRDPLTDKDPSKCQHNEWHRVGEVGPSSLTYNVQCVHCKVIGTQQGGMNTWSGWRPGDHEAATCPHASVTHGTEDQDRRTTPITCDACGLTGVEMQSGYRHWDRPPVIKGIVGRPVCTAHTPTQISGGALRCTRCGALGTIEGERLVWSEPPATAHNPNDPTVLAAAAVARMLTGYTTTRSFPTGMPERIVEMVVEAVWRERATVLAALQERTKVLTEHGFIQREEEGMKGWWWPTGPEALKQELDAAKAQIAAMKAERDAAVKAHEALHDNWTQHSVKMNEVVKERDAARQELDALQRALARAHADKARFLDSLEAAVKDRDIVVKERDALKAAIGTATKDVNTELAGIRQELDALREERKRMLDHVNGADAARRVVVKRAEEAEKALASARADVSYLARELDLAREKAEAYLKAMNECNTHNVAVGEKHVVEIENLKRERDEIAAKLKNQLPELNKRIADEMAARDVALITEERNKLRIEKRNIIDQRDRLEKERDDARYKIAALQSEIEGWRAGERSYKERIETMEQNAETYQKRNDALTTRIEQQKERIADLERALSRAGHAWPERVPDKEEALIRREKSELTDAIKRAQQVVKDTLAREKAESPPRPLPTGPIGAMDRPPVDIDLTRPVDWSRLAMQPPWRGEQAVDQGGLPHLLDNRATVAHVLAALDTIKRPPVTSYGPWVQHMIVAALQAAGVITSGPVVVKT